MVACTLTVDLQWCIDRVQISIDISIKFSDLANRCLVPKIYDVVASGCINSCICMNSFDSQMIVTTSGIDLDELNFAVCNLHLRNH